MESRNNVPDSVRPDEWGVYDPERAGFAAVLRRLGTGRDTQETPALRRPLRDAEPPQRDE